MERKALAVGFNEGSRITSKPWRLAAPQDGPSAAASEAHTSAATAPTKTARATAATVTVLLGGTCHRRGLCTRPETCTPSGR